MGRFLVVLLLLVACVVGLGFYLGWFHFSSTSTDQKTNYQIEVDKDKIKQDREKATEKIRQAGQQVKDRTGAKTEKREEERSHP